MTDIVEELRECAKRQLAIAPTYIEKSLEWLAANEIESLRKQLAECQAREKVLRDALTLSWSEEYVNGIIVRSKARDALTLPFDSTALDTMLKQAKLEEREACAKVCEAIRANRPMTGAGRLIAEECAISIRNMAKELE